MLRGCVVKDVLSGGTGIDGRWPRAPLRKAGARIREFLGCKSGVSAVEFSLIAPTLVFAVFATVDLGLGFSDRMNIEHVLRAGAQSAVTDPGDAAVLTVMSGAATTNFSLAGSADPGPTPLTLSSVRFCACPESPNTAVSCLTVCAGSEPTFIFYRLSAQKAYTPWLLPSVAFDSSIRVQIR